MTNEATDASTGDALVADAIVRHRGLPAWAAILLTGVIGGLIGVPPLFIMVLGIPAVGGTPSPVRPDTLQWLVIGGAACGAVLGIVCSVGALYVRVIVQTFTRSLAMELIAIVLGTFVGAVAGYLLLTGSVPWQPFALVGTVAAVSCVVFCLIAVHYRRKPPPGGGVDRVGETSGGRDALENE